VNGAILEGLARFGREVAQLDGRVQMRIDREAVAADVVSWLVHQNVPVYEVRAHRPSLEQVFLDVMGDDARPG
jgi:hypothetical protein